MSPDVLIEALKALLLGIVEGITEWLPISSTGHMILVDEFVQLNVSPQFLELFLVVIPNWLYQWRLLFRFVIN